MTQTPARLALMIAGLLLLSACDPSDDKAASQAGVSHSNLPETPIVVSDAFSEKALQTGLQNCPFLSDATALATVNARDIKLKLSEASTTRCIWDYNQAFRVKVTVKQSDNLPALTAANLKLKKSYSIEPQSGPGEQAVALLYHDGVEPKAQVYGFVFQLIDQQVDITVSGLYTNVEKLRRTADEVARKLPGAKPGKENKPFKLCDHWPEAGLKQLFSAQGDIELGITAYNRSCNLHIYPKSSRHSYKVNMELNSGNAQHCTQLEAMGYKKQTVSQRELLVVNESYSGTERTEHQLCMSSGPYYVLTSITGPDQRFHDQYHSLLTNFINRVQ